MKAEYISHMGDDLFIANVARVSFDKVSDEFTYITDKMKGSDEGIINYLAKHQHWTPFAHPQISLRMKAPVPIRTQCFKHKAGLVENEESRRYIQSEPEVFYPEYFRSKPEGSAKQGSEGRHPTSSYWEGQYKKVTSYAVNTYLSMVDNQVCTEQARLVLPQGCYVNWIWTGSLASFARFYNQRTDSHAQKEIQELANEVGAIISPLFPVAWEALTNYEETK